MKIFFDLNHPCDINFFKHVIQRLKGDGHTLFFSVLNRPPLPKIVKKELENYPYKIIGNHRGNLLSIVFEANIFKFFTLFFYVLKIRPDIGISFGSFILGSILKLLRIPNIQFDDDPERKINVLLEKATSTKLIFPPIVPASTNATIMNALKEWAYLSPKYFRPNSEALNRYLIEKRKYIFIREVSTASLNYNNQASNLISQIASKLPVNYTVIFSLEEKSTINLYPKSWILLNEPVEDIHSLMYYSSLIISSGDSMAREGAIMGVPSIYCGKREMAANKILIDKGLLFKRKINNVPLLVHQIISNEVEIENQSTVRKTLEDEWDDVPQFIIENVYGLSGNDYDIGK